MLTDNNRKATILAYYFSKFDRDAMMELGYGTLTEAFSDLSLRIGKENYYLKLRRDEFDPLTGSHRVGFNKREPNAIVHVFHDGLKNYSFEELTKIVKALISDTSELNISKFEREETRKIISNYSEEEIESVINGKDPTSKILQNEALIKSRVFNAQIQNSLKALYEYRCQVCGARAIEMYGVDVSEAHHIQYFSITANNNANNIIIVCPDHHHIIHKAIPIYNKMLKQFEYENGYCDKLMYNIHL